MKSSEKRFPDKTNLFIISVEIFVEVDARASVIVINPYHATGLFVYPLMFSRGIERDQWNGMGEFKYLLKIELKLQRRIQNPLKDLRWNFLQKQ